MCVNYRVQPLVLEQQQQQQQQQQNTKNDKVLHCTSTVRTRADQVTVSHSVQFTSTGFPFGAQLIVTDQGEHMIFVPLGLAYFTQHNVFQIPPSCCK